MNSFRQLKALDEQRNKEKARHARELAVLLGQHWKAEAYKWTLFKKVRSYRRFVGRIRKQCEDLIGRVFFKARLSDDDEG